MMKKKLLPKKPSASPAGSNAGNQNTDSKTNQSNSSSVIEDAKWIQNNLNLYAGKPGASTPAAQQRLYSLFTDEKLQELLKYDAKNRTNYFEAISQAAINDCFASMGFYNADVKFETTPDCKNGFLMSTRYSAPERSHPKYGVINSSGKLFTSNMYRKDLVSPDKVRSNFYGNPSTGTAQAYLLMLFNQSRQYAQYHQNMNAEALKTDNALQQRCNAFIKWEKEGGKIPDDLKEGAEAVDPIVLDSYNYASNRIREINGLNLDQGKLPETDLKQELEAINQETDFFQDLKTVYQTAHAFMNKYVYEPFNKFLKTAYPQFANACSIKIAEFKEMWNEAVGPKEPGKITPIPRHVPLENQQTEQQKKESAVKKDVPATIAPVQPESKNSGALFTDAPETKIDAELSLGE